jgi:precorrin-6B methylase 2
MKNEFQMTFKLKRIGYYLSVIQKLLMAMPFNSWAVILQLAIKPGEKKIIQFPKLGLKYYIDTFGDLLVLKEIVLDKVYGEVPTKAGVMVDIGGGMGDLAIMTAKINPRLKIYSFEPDGHYFKLLKDNILLNRVRSIRAINKPAKNLEEILKITQKPVDFIKVDCEGDEFEIFNKSQEKYLNKYSRIVMEYHESGKNRVEIIEKLLNKTGFKVDIYPQVQVPRLGYLIASK